MKNQEIKINLQYEETYQIKGKRLPRIRLAEKEITVTIPTFDFGELPVAFITYDYYKSKNYYYYGGRLFTDNVKITYDDFIKKLSTAAKLDSSRTYYENLIADTKTGISDFQKMCEKLKYWYEDLICYCGYMYNVADEPMYTYRTYGLGNNHGGTSLIIEEVDTTKEINPKHYYNALERDLAVDVAKKVAESRGDSNYIDGIGERVMIEVLMPEVVTPIDRDNKKEKRMKLQVCTREQSLKLKELGFNYPTNEYYPKRKNVFDETYRTDLSNHNDTNYSISAPTVELALQWIRNEKYIFSAFDFCVNKHNDVGYKWKYFAICDKLFYSETEHRFASYESAQNDLLDELLTAIQESEVNND